MNKVGDKTVTYCWVGAGKEGFVLETATQELSVAGDETVKAFKAGEFTDGWTFTASATATNVEQKALQKIVKQDSYTNKYVGRAKVTVTDAEGKTVSGKLVTTTGGTINVADEETQINNAEDPGGAACCMWLSRGTYTVIETTVPGWLYLRGGILYGSYTCENDFQLQCGDCDCEEHSGSTVTVEKIVDGAAVNGVEFERAISEYTATGEGANMTFTRAKDTAKDEATIIFRIQSADPQGNLLPEGSSEHCRFHEGRTVPG